MDGEDYSHGVMQPDENNCIGQNRLSSNTAATLTAPKSSTSSEFTTQRHQNNNDDRTIFNDHEKLIDDVSNNKPCTSSLDSLKMSDRLHSHMNEARRLIPIGRTVEKYLRLTNIARNVAITSQNPSNFMNQTIPLSTSSVQEQPLVVSKAQLSPYSETIKMKIQVSSARQNSINASTLFYETPKLPQMQLQSNQQDSQRQPQKPKICVRISIKPKNNKQLHTRRGVMKKIVPRVLASVLSAVQQTSSVTSSQSAKSTELNQTGSTTASQNVSTTATCNINNTEMPTCSFYQSPTQPSSSAHKETYENQTQKQSVNQSTGTDSDMRYAHFTKNFSSSPVIESHLKVTDNVCQIEDNEAEEPPSPYYAEPSDSVTNQEAISDHEMSVDEAPAETMNNVYCIGIATGSNSTDRPTAQNSTSTNKRSTSRNVISVAPQATEERQIDVTARESSNNEASHSENVAIETPKRKHNNLWRFALPPEYDPHDTRWTLKYREKLPGLVELMPGSHIYISYGEIKYCKLYSKNCKSLARQLLLAVFKREALSVCLSMTEQAQVSHNVGSNVRPALDEHATTVLLNFVIEHGLQCGWEVDLQPILNTLHRKIQRIRFKYGVMVKVN